MNSSSRDLRPFDRNIACPWHRERCGRRAEYACQEGSGKQQKQKKLLFCCHWAEKAVACGSCNITCNLLWGRTCRTCRTCSWEFHLGNVFDILLFLFSPPEVMTIHFPFFQEVLKFRKRGWEGFSNTQHPCKTGDRLCCQGFVPHPCWNCLCLRVSPHEPLWWDRTAFGTSCTERASPELRPPPAGDWAGMKAASPSLLLAMWQPVLQFRRKTEKTRFC